MNLELKDKIVIITGGSRGIGRACALRFAEEGCHVAICARGQEGLDKALDDIREFGVKAFGQTTDVAQKGQTEAFIQNAADALGGIDCLVNNVGGTAGSRAFESSDDNAWQETFDLNLFHAVRATRSALPFLKGSSSPSVVTISSISGWKPANSGAQYGATKAAEMFLAGALAWELGPHNIRVNTVCPGSLFFPGGGWERFKEANPDQYETFRTREFPAQRLGTDFEVADVVVFLSSSRANWINGASIPVDGAQGRPNAF